MQRVSLHEARGLFLAGQGLSRPRPRRTTAAALQRGIEKLGFVQVDSIQVLERAHHLILAARFRGYRPAQLKRLLEQQRSLFEHWTHDAAVLPASLLPFWTFRFERYAREMRTRLAKRSGASRRFAALLAEVRGRIEREGPLLSSDFEAPPGRRGGGWWNWKPAKHALEYLWRTGELAITGRERFQKRYDLFHRVHPERRHAPKIDLGTYLDWAIPAALERLGVAGTRELSQFWGGVTAAETRAWCESALRDGRLIEAEIEASGGKGPLPGLRVALPELGRRLAGLREAPDELRLLCPFDPLLRDRERTERLFGFSYRFEAFVPAAKRRDGYYVMSVLDGDQLVARFDPKLDRRARVLEVQRLRWEPGARTPQRDAALATALDELAVRLDATSKLQKRGRSSAFSSAADGRLRGAPWPARRGR